MEDVTSQESSSRLAMPCLVVFLVVQVVGDFAPPCPKAFRRRVRMFPAIVNCCTIVWGSKKASLTKYRRCNLEEMVSG